MARKDSQVPAPQPVEGNGDKPPAIAGVNDTIARNRALRIIAASQVPRPPEVYKPTSPEERRRRLRLLDSDLFAEAGEAMREQIARAESLRSDLGDMAPDPAEAPGILTRFEQAIATRNALELAMAYNDECLSIAASDVVHHLEAANEEYEHRAGRRPHLALYYPKLVSFFAARSTAISEGIARSKAARKPTDTDGNGAPTP